MVTLLNPHGSDETVHCLSVCGISTKLLNPHGSDETKKIELSCILYDDLLNPHGSDETHVPIVPELKYVSFLTHTVQMKLLD